MPLHKRHCKTCLCHLPYSYTSDERTSWSQPWKSLPLVVDHVNWDAGFGDRGEGLNKNRAGARKRGSLFRRRRRQRLLNLSIDFGIKGRKRAAPRERPTPDVPSRVDAPRAEEQSWSFWERSSGDSGAAEAGSIDSGLSFFTLPTGLSTFHAVILSASRGRSRSIGKRSGSAFNHRT